MKIKHQTDCRGKPEIFLININNLIKACNEGPALYTFSELSTVWADYFCNYAK